MNAPSVSHAERRAATQQHLAQIDRAWPRLVADSRRPSLAWRLPPAASERDEPALMKLAISCCG